MTHEFLTVRRVSEVLAGFRPARRTAAENVDLDACRGRVPSRDVLAAQPLPGFARATVDGYAVRAADTFGAADSLPAYLDVIGEVAMGEAPRVGVGAGTAVAIPTGGLLPEGADAVVMVEHTAVTTRGVVEVTHAAAAGDGLVRADEDVRVGEPLARAGAPLRSQDLALLAAAGITGVSVQSRPRVAVLSTGDEVVPRDTAVLRPGQVRDATASGLAALIAESGGRAVLRGIVPDDPQRLRVALADALAVADVVVVSAGSSVGERDATAQVVATLGAPGVWCHGLALRPGKPTLLADCDGVPVIGLPGNPLSALVVFRLVGLPLVRLVGGWSATPAVATVRARIDRDVASAAGRLDIVQVRLRDGVAEPLLGRSALLSLLARADGFVRIPEEAGGLYGGALVDVEPYG